MDTRYNAVAAAETFTPAYPKAIETAFRRNDVVRHIKSGRLGKVTRVEGSYFSVAAEESFKNARGMLCDGWEERAEAFELVTAAKRPFQY